MKMKRHEVPRMYNAILYGVLLFTNLFRFLVHAVVRWGVCSIRPCTLFLFLCFSTLISNELEEVRTTNHLLTWLISGTFSVSTFKILILNIDFALNFPFKGHSSRIYLLNSLLRIGKQSRCYKVLSSIQLSSTSLINCASILRSALIIAVIPTD